MTKYVIRRVLQLLIVLFGVTLLTFILINAAPSDPAEMRFISKGITPPPDILARTREEMGLNQPFITRYFIWLFGVLRGDLGDSVKFSEPVLVQLGKKLPYTLMLAGVSSAFMIMISLPLGILAAVKKNKTVDYVIRGATFIGMSMPEFWLGLLLMYFFAVKLGWLKVVSQTNAAGLILPSMTLVIIISSIYIRHIRTAVLEELNSNYVIGARARGLKESQIIFRHVIPNAIPGIIIMFGLSVGGLLGGSAIIETLFSWQGIGSMVVEAIRVRDYSLIQGYAIWMAVIYVFINLAVDIACRALDPQARLKRRVE